MRCSSVAHHCYSPSACSIAAPSSTSSSLFSSSASLSSSASASCGTSFDCSFAYVDNSFVLIHSIPAYFMPWTMDPHRSEQHASVPGPNHLRSLLPSSLPPTSSFSIVDAPHRIKSELTWSQLVHAEIIGRRELSIHILLSTTL